MKSEISSLKENAMWILEQLAIGYKAIPCKWVYKVKQNQDGSFDQFKSRLLIKGSLQRKEIDCDQTFSPVARASSI
jgi:hypothetical protein